jgi:hypothetical protein
VAEEALLARAPDMDVAGSRVRLEGLRYRISLDLAGEGGGDGLSGEITLDATPGRSVPPFVVRGRAGWVSGYVVPVLSGELRGRLRTGGREVSLDGATGYHDHNWGFWEGVTWQWGQVQHGDLSFVYGRVHPPPDAADPGRVPGFLGVLGPEGPVGYAADVSIEETSEPGTGRPSRIVVEGRGPALSLEMSLEVEDAAVTRMGPELFGGGMDFYQLRVRYRVAGEVAGRTLEFVAPGSAETFRGR